MIICKVSRFVSNADAAQLGKHIARCIAEGRPLVFREGIDISVLDIADNWGCVYCGRINRQGSSCMGCNAPRVRVERMQ